MQGPEIEFSVAQDVTYWIPSRWTRIRRIRTRLRSLRRQHPEIFFQVWLEEPGVRVKFRSDQDYLMFVMIWRRDFEWCSYDISTAPTYNPAQDPARDRRGRDSRTSDHG